MQETTLMDVLKIKVGLRVRLCHNVDVQDMLSNGQDGVIEEIVTDTESNVHLVIVKFDDARVGVQHREKHASLLKNVGRKEGIPIFKITFSFSIGDSAKAHGAKAKVEQFPLVAAYALTAHKVQGQTIKYPTPVVTDLETLFCSQHAYVVFNRVQELEQLFFLTFNEKKIMTSKDAKEKVRAMKVPEMSQWFCQKTKSFLKIAHINIKSLRKHFNDLTRDHTIMQADVICLSETWLHENEQLESFQIPDFTLYTMSNGRGKGAAIYCKGELLFPTINRFSGRDYSLVIVCVENCIIASLYLSNDHEKSSELFFILSQFVLETEMPCVIVGDFNSEPTKTFYIYKYLNIYNFTQYVRYPTFDGGSCLDHFYSNVEPEFFCQHAVFFSDHDCLCAIIRV